MGNWFGKGNRGKTLIYDGYELEITKCVHVQCILGFIFGIWNSHTSIGNIIGTLLASWFVETNWGLSFILPGIFIISFGFLNYLFLVVHPSDLNNVSHLTEKPQNGRKVRCIFYFYGLKFINLYNVCIYIYIYMYVLFYLI